MSSRKIAALSFDNYNLKCYLISATCRGLWPEWSHCKMRPESIDHLGKNGFAKAVGEEARCFDVFSLQHYCITAIRYANRAQSARALIEPSGHYHKYGGHSQIRPRGRNRRPWCPRHSRVFLSPH